MLLPWTPLWVKYKSSITTTCACFDAWLCSPALPSIPSVQQNNNFASTAMHSKCAGVTLHELIDVEDVFEINVMGVFARTSR